MIRTEYFNRKILQLITSKCSIFCFSKIQKIVENTVFIYFLDLFHFFLLLFYAKGVLGSKVLKLGSVYSVDQTPLTSSQNNLTYRLILGYFRDRASLVVLIAKYFFKNRTRQKLCILLGFSHMSRA